MPNYKFDKIKLLEETNCGLDVILHYYPQAEHNGKFQHFQLSFRNEKTPSAKIAPLKGDCYYVKDFGSGESYSCFDLVKEEEGLENFGDICKHIAGIMGLSGGTVVAKAAKLEFIPAEPEQKHGDYYYDINENPSAEALKVLGPLVTGNDLARLGFSVLNSFTQVKAYPKNHKNEKCRGKIMQIITHATENYPIFLLDCGAFQKIYQPFANKKDYKFRYVGTKPKAYLVGVDRMEAEYEQQLRENLQDLNTFSIVDESEGKSVTLEEDTDTRLDCILIASGERDALNISSLGYHVVWKNSESEPLTYENWQRLNEIAKKVVNVPDIDETGYKMGVEMAMQYIDIYTLWLPEWLKGYTYKTKDNNGKYVEKYRNDMTDFCNVTFNQNGESYLRKLFSMMINSNVAHRTRFWDIIKDSKGNFKRYSFNSEACYRFLQYEGFYVIKEKFSKEPHEFIHVKDNVIKRVYVDDVKNYPGNWVRRKLYPMKLLNFIHDTGKLPEKKLSKIKEYIPDTVHHGSDFQRFFFKNKVWTVTADAVLETQYKSLKKPVWAEKIIDKNVSLNKNKSFKITKNEMGNWTIDVLKTDNHFFNYLINTSRVHWKVLGNAPYENRIDAIDTNLSPLEHKQARDKILAERQEYRNANQFNIAEENLTADKVQEQVNHLVNKIFCIGYLLHQYKRADRSWAVFAMDHKISDITESNGGTGKSVMLAKAIPEITKSYEYIAANDPEVYNDKFMLGNVTPNTDYVIFDDMDSHFPIRKVYTQITGNFAVRAPHVPNFYIPFEQSAKLAFTSNFGLWSAEDGSTERRILYCSFSDYYHYKTAEHFENWTVRDDFGKILFSDFNEKEYNDFYNFMAECLQFYLSCDEKIDPPMDHINKRNQKQTMGDAFLDWADVYFNDKLNAETSKDEAFEDYKLRTKLNKTTPQRFKKSLKSWAKYHGYIFNPKDKADASGRIMMRYNGVVTEMLYIRGTAEAARMAPDDDDSFTDGIPF